MTILAAFSRRVSRRRVSFTQADVARALRAAEQVAPGKMLVEVEPGGVIRIKPLASNPDEASPTTRPDDEANDDLAQAPRWRL
jgi:hypothetical protein